MFTIFYCIFKLKNDIEKLVWTRITDQSICSWLNCFVYMKQYFQTNVCVGILLVMSWSCDYDTINYLTCNQPYFNCKILLLNSFPQVYSYEFYTELCKSEHWEHFYWTLSTFLCGLNLHYFDSCLWWLATILPQINFVLPAGSYYKTYPSPTPLENPI